MSFINNRIVPYVFKVSQVPMRFKELLKANKVYHDGMNIENNIHGFRMRLGRAYLVFLSLWLVALVVVTIVFHGLLAKVNCHALIIMTAVITGGFFITFSMFKESLIDRMAQQFIRKSWNRHLGLFDYDEKSKDVAHFYGEALEKEIPIGDLQRFIFDKLSDS